VASLTFVLMATATFPLVAATGGGPPSAEGEEVKWVRVACTFGGGPIVSDITASGKKVPGPRVAAFRL